MRKILSGMFGIIVLFGALVTQSVRAVEACAEPECVPAVTVQYRWLDSLAKPGQNTYFPCTGTDVGDRMLSFFNSTLDDVYAVGDTVSLYYGDNWPFAYNVAGPAQLSSDGKSFTITTPTDESGTIVYVIVGPGVQLPGKVYSGVDGSYYYGGYRCADFLGYNPDGRTLPSFGFIVGYRRDVSERNVQTIFVPKITDTALEFSAYAYNPSYTATPNFLELCQASGMDSGQCNTLGRTGSVSGQAYIDTQGVRYQFIGWGMVSDRNGDRAQTDWLMDSRFVEDNTELADLRTGLENYGVFYPSWALAATNPNVNNMFKIASTEFPWYTYTVDHQQVIRFYPLYARPCEASSACNSDDNFLKSKCSLSADSGNLGWYSYVNECCWPYARVGGSAKVASYRGAACVGSTYMINMLDDADLLYVGDDLTASFSAKLVDSVRQSKVTYGSELVITPSDAASGVSVDNWPFYYVVGGKEYRPNEEPFVVNKELFDEVGSLWERGEPEISIKMNDVDSELKVINVDKNNGEAPSAPMFLVEYDLDDNSVKGFWRILYQDGDPEKSFVGLEDVTSIFQSYVARPTADGQVFRGWVLGDGAVDTVSRNSGALSDLAAKKGGIAITPYMESAVAMSDWIERVPYIGRDNMSFYAAYAAQCGVNTVSDCRNAVTESTPMCRLNVNGQDGSVIYNNGCCSDGYTLKAPVAN